MQDIMLWLNNNPVWLVILAALLTNLPKLLDLARWLAEKILPGWLAVHTARQEIEKKEQGAMVALLARFLDEEQEERKEERQSCQERTFAIAQDLASLTRSSHTLVQGNQKQNEQVITALVTVAESQRRSAERMDNLYALLADLAQEVRQGYTPRGRRQENHENE